VPIGNTLIKGLEENFTIANMTSGLHTLTVYANDTFGNIGVSENATFTVDLPASSTSFSIPIFATVSGAVVFVALGLYIY
jgi:hypothetical protein